MDNLESETAEQRREVFEARGLHLVDLRGDMGCRRT